MKKIFLLLISGSLLITSCDHLTPGDAEKAKANKNAVPAPEDFVYPDSIARHHHIVATFYDVQHEEHGIIFLSDTSNKNAMIVKYKPDGKLIMSDSLWTEGSNKFVSIKTKGEYIIRERVVGFSNRTSQTKTMENIQGYPRTDIPE